MLHLGGAVHVVRAKNKANTNVTTRTQCKVNANTKVDLNAQVRAKAKGRKTQRPKQGDFLPKPSRQHGGSLSVGKRRSFRPMNPKLSLHITLKSEHAMGPRSLFRHKKLILSIMHKASQRFNVKVYNYALAGNHLHLLIKGSKREEIQNFFRVFAGHVAQRILKDFPLTKTEQGGAHVKTSDDLTKTRAGGAPGSVAITGKNKGCLKNQRKFWRYLIYSRMVTWGKEFRVVSEYLEKNILETLRIIAYEPRTYRKKTNSS